MEKVAMELTEEQFRYLRLLDGLQEDEKYTAANLAERTGDKERNVRRYLGSLVKRDIYFPEPIRLQRKGDALSQSSIFGGGRVFTGL